SLIDKKNRLVLTNFHVVDGGPDSHLYVFFPTYRKGLLVVEKDEYVQMIKDNQAIPAFLEQKDPKLDLALIRLAGLPSDQNVQQIRLAHDSVVPGQRVYSVGNPGAGHSFFMMTSGNARSYPHHQRMKVLKGQDSKDIMEVEATIIESQSPI